MKKKSLVAMGLAGVMTIGMCVPVLAAETNNEYANGTATGSADIEVVKDVSYTVVIPKKVSITNNSGICKVSLKEAPVLDFKGSVTVAPSGLTGESSNTLELVDTKNGENKINSTFGETVGNQLNLSTLEQTYSITTDDAEYAGTYSGTVTFSILYSDGGTAS